MPAPRSAPGGPAGSSPRAGTAGAGYGRDVLTDSVADRSVPARPSGGPSREPLLLRQVIGDVLRRRRLDQGRTLRDVAAAGRVSLGYLSEVERGQKEASSELLAAICEALDARLSDVLREVSDDLAGGAGAPAPRVGANPTRPKTITVPPPSAPRRPGPQARASMGNPTAGTGSAATIRVTHPRDVRAGRRPVPVSAA